jgi:hypothetical protein
MKSWKILIKKLQKKKKRIKFERKKLRWMKFEKQIPKKLNNN